MEIAVIGPTKITGVSETPSRQAASSRCHPTAPAAQRACAEQIVTRLGTQAYRRPLTAARSRRPDGVLRRSGADGRRLRGGRPHRRSRRCWRARTSCSASRRRRRTSRPGRTTGSATSSSRRGCRSSSGAASPTTSCSTLAAAEQAVRTEDARARRCKRMLADPRSEALSTRFAAQWLRLQDLEKVHPDAFLFPDYDQQLADDDAARDRAVLQRHRQERPQHPRSVHGRLHVRERAARQALRHSERRRPGVPHASTYPDSTRRGLLGQGSMLVQTSLANRTSPVLRGKWVMEVLIGMPPPPPPPNVPDARRDGRTARTASRSRRASAWRCTARTRRARRATSTWIRSGWRSTTST